MRSNRTRNGGTLALIAVSIVIIALVGIGLFFLTRLLGGHRELDFATRSGNLNVAKQAIVDPAEALTPGLEQDNFAGLVDTDPMANGGVNLRVYNRLVGQALLVALNASVDPNTTGKTNAANLINTMQSSGGIGGRLRTRLSSQGSTNGFFDFLGMRNSTRMLGQGQLAAAVYQPSYVEARVTDIGATNILVPVANQLPVKANGSKEDIGTQFKRKLKQADGNDHQYFRGYLPLDLQPGLGVQCSLIGVPVQPGSQPHLVSSAEFAAGLNQFGGTNTFVPPNAFEFGSQKQDQFTAGNASSASRAIVGSLTAEFEPSIPLGYLVVDNPNGLTNPASNNPSSPGPLDAELDPGLGGIGVDNGTKMFSSNNQLIEDWRVHNKKSQNKEFFENGKDLCPADCMKKDTTATTEDLFTQNGDKATRSAAHQISPEGSTTACDDNNSVNGKNNEGVAPCPSLLNNFGKAYPDGGPYVSPAAVTGDNLTAVESAKADVMDKFNTCGDLNLSNPATKTTGLRIWACPPTKDAAGVWQAPACKWPENGNASSKGQISSDGTVGDLFEQTEPGKKAVVESFITQRLYQIKPKATPAEINAILAQKVPLSASKYYIYMAADKTLKFNTTKPPGANAIQAADGTPKLSQMSYETQDKWMNPKGENHIHDQLYKCASGSVTSQDQANFTASSGFNNLLGEFKFENKVTTAGAYYCCPD